MSFEILALQFTQEAQIQMNHNLPLYFRVEEEIHGLNKWLETFQQTQQVKHPNSEPHLFGSLIEKINNYGDFNDCIKLYLLSQYNL